VMPMVPVTMKKQIRIEFPYYKQPNFKIVAYIHNLLKMLDYCPNMMHDVLELIFENLLLIDVNVTREQIEQSEDTDCDDSDDDFERMKLPVAETLDMCMEKVLGYFQVKLNDDAEVDREQQKVMTQAIFHYFDEQILKTYTKHVHFVLFYIASLKVS
jgi:RNA polymerase I specific transcription initiation factor RRN3